MDAESNSSDLRRRNSPGPASSPCQAEHKVRNSGLDHNDSLTSIPSSAHDEPPLATVVHEEDLQSEIDIVAVHCLEQFAEASSESTEQRNSVPQFAKILQDYGFFPTITKYRLLEYRCTAPENLHPGSVDSCRVTSSFGLLRALKQAGLGKSSRPIVFVGHGLGCIAVAAALLKSPRLRFNTVGRICFSSPRYLDLSALEKTMLDALPAYQLELAVENLAFSAFDIEPLRQAIVASLMRSFHISWPNRLIQAIHGAHEAKSGSGALKPIRKLITDHYAELAEEPKALIALFEAASHGQYPVVMRLLDARVNPNMVPQANYGRWTFPLIAASQNGHLGVVELLLKRGADHTLTDHRGRSAKDVATLPEIRELLEKRPAVLGPSLFVQQTEAVDQSSQTDWEDRKPENDSGCIDEFYGRVVEFFHAKGAEVHIPSHQTVHDIVYGRGPTDIISTLRPGNDGLGTRKFRWIHLPANNLRWMQDLIDRLSSENGVHSDALCTKGADGRDGFIQYQHWSSQQDVSPVEALAHVRTIKPQVKVFSQSETGDGLDSKDTLLFLPYLHHESYFAQQNMADMIQEIWKSKERGRPHTPYGRNSSERSRDEKLLWAHLYDKHLPLHCRRTLDQYYYYTFDTRDRDRDQVAFRYARDRWGDRNPHIIMVDQLWLAVLGSGEEQTSDLLNVLGIFWLTAGEDLALT